MEVSPRLAQVLLLALLRLFSIALQHGSPFLPWEPGLPLSMGPAVIIMFTQLAMLLLWYLS